MVLKEKVVKTYLIETYVDGQLKEYPLEPHAVQQLANQLLNVNNDWRISAILGRKIDAIKTFRELTGAGLKEAKDCVENFCRLTSTEEAARLLRDYKAGF